MTIREKIAMSEDDKKRLVGKAIKGTLIGGAAGGLGGATGLGRKLLTGTSGDPSWKGFAIGGGIGAAALTARELLRKKKEEKSSVKKASFVEKNELITKAAADQGMTFDQFVYRLGLATAEKFIDDAR